MVGSPFLVAISIVRHHETSTTPLRNGHGNTANTGPPARRPGRSWEGERAQLVVHHEVTDRRIRDPSTPRAAACFPSRVDLRAAGSRPWCRRLAIRPRQRVRSF